MTHELEDEEVVIVLLHFSFTCDSIHSVFGRRILDIDGQRNTYGIISSSTGLTCSNVGSQLSQNIIISYF